MNNAPLSDQELASIWFGYIDAAQWADTPYNEEGTDTVDFDEWEFSDTLRFAVLDFVTENAEDVSEYARLSNRDYEGFGRNLWLSARGHGAGFWDKGYGALGDRLGVACKGVCGEPILYDDGIVRVDY